MEFQQPHRYMRPPPPQPSTAEPHHQLPPHPRPPIPPASGPFYSTQFQYQHSSSPAPPQMASAQPYQQHWPPPPPPPPAHLPDYAPYPASSHSPYHAHTLPNNQYTSPAPLPPRPHVPHQIPHSYPPQVHQDWSNMSWGHHQGWDHPAHNSEEVWAAKARAWAAAQAASDSQDSQSQFTPARPEEQSQYYYQYQQTSLSTSSYDQYPASAAATQRTHVGHLQELSPINSGQLFYVSGQHFDNGSGDGTLAGDGSDMFPHQQLSSTSQVVHQQEVPSSYSSVAGKEEAGHQNEHFHKSVPLPVTSTLQQHTPLPPFGKSIAMDQSQYAVGNQSIDPSDQPLDFAPRVGPGLDSHVQANYAHDSAGAVGGLDPSIAMPPMQSWNSSTAPGVAYPSIPPVFPSGQQVDPSVPLPSSITGHSAHLIGRMSGPTFQQPLPLGGASFGLGTGTAVLPPAFPVDAYGASGVPERPKKAPVPNWLREEIIKTKAAMTSSAPELPKAEALLEDDVVDKSLGKDDRADNRSIDSSKSTEEDDDDEDDVEAARTAATNQEIKRVLTEVLLKVTDELLDEIATNVLSEEDITIEVDHNNADPNPKVSISPAVLTPTASASVLIPAKASKTDTDDVSGNSSSAPGDVLGLASYASDEDEDEIHSSSVLNSNEINQRHHPIMKEHSEDTLAVENGRNRAESKNRLTTKNVGGRKSLNLAIGNSIAKDEINGDDDKVLDGDANISKDVGEEVIVESELPVDNSNIKRTVSDNSLGREAGNKSDKNNSLESRKSSVDRDKTYQNRDEDHRRHEEKHVRKGKTDIPNGSKERTKEEGLKSGEKVKGSDSRKRSLHAGDMDDKKDMDKYRRASHKEVDERIKERRNDEKGERSRHKTSGSGRHKRRRSSSIGSRGRHSKDHPVVSNVEDSSDDSSEDSRRKSSHRRRNLSPSPVVSRRRKVSRSPHSKHSQRRHSPYSSLETTRGKKSRSRSRSPARRKR